MARSDYSSMGTTSLVKKGYMILRHLNSLL